MRYRIAIVALLGLTATAPLPQTAPEGTRLAECRLPLRDAMKAALKFQILKRVRDPDTGDVTAVLRPAGLIVLGQPAQALNVVRSTHSGQRTSFVTRIALDYPAARTALPKAYGRAKCDKEGTAITYCQMNLPEDASMGRNRVSIGVEPAEGGGTMLSCDYQKLGT